MSFVKSLSVVVILAFVMGAQASGAVDPPAASESVKARQPAPDGRDAAALAAEMLGRLSKRDFVGIIAFESELEGWGNGSPKTVHQRGKLHCGPNGEVRLDLWLGGKPDPIVCCVKGDKAWMVWTNSPDVYHSPYPVCPGTELSGWNRQLRYQARETVRSADWLLQYGLPERQAGRIVNAEITDGRLRVELSSEGKEPPAPTHIEAVRLPESGEYFPTQMTLESGSVLVLEAPRQTSNGKLIARRHIFHSCREHKRTSLTFAISQFTWTITSIVERDDDDFLAIFEAPSQRSGAYPHLIGECVFDCESKELECTCWN